MVISPPDDSAMARRSAFSSSRTLPGKSCAANAWLASRVNRGIAEPAG